MPIVLSTVSIWAIYLLAKEIHKDELIASLSSVSFAMSPPSITWFIMGGGVTRTFGILFSIFTMLFAYRLFTKGKWINCLLTSIFGSLLLLSHPQWILQTIGVIIIFLLKFDNKDKNIKFSFITAIIIIIITMPWWLTVIQTDSTSMSNAIKTGFHNFANFLIPFLLTFGKEPFFPIITLTGVLGLIHLIQKGSYWYGLWFLYPFFIDPRSAFSAASIPVSIASGIGLLILLQTLNMCSSTNLVEPSTKDFEKDYYYLSMSRTSKIGIGFFLIYTLAGGFANTLQITDVVLKTEVINSFSWIKQNIPPNSNFLVISAEPLFSNPIQEWFYPLTKSNSLTTYQGREWLPDFDHFVSNNATLQDCKYKTISCLNEWLTSNNIDYEYIYLYEGKVPTLGTEDIQASLSLGESLKADNLHLLVYQSQNIKIFKLKYDE